MFGVTTTFDLLPLRSLMYISYPKLFVGNSATDSHGKIPVVGGYIQHVDLNKMRIVPLMPLLAPCEGINGAL